MRLQTIRRHLAAAATALLAATGAQAAVVGIEPDADLSAGPFTVALPGGVSYTFADSGERGGFFDRALPAVRTSGPQARVNFNVPIFGGDVATYFTDEGRRPVSGPGVLGEWKAAPEFETIDAQTSSYIILEFDLADGTHYGFALLSGLTLFDFAYESEPGRAVRARPGPFEPIAAPIPLPAGLPLLAGALGGLALLRRRRRAA